MWLHVAVMRVSECQPVIDSCSMSEMGLMVLPMNVIHSEV
jgi:hypothetical protein